MEALKGAKEMYFNVGGVSIISTKLRGMSVIFLKQNPLKTLTFLNNSFYACILRLIITSIGGG